MSRSLTIIILALAAILAISCGDDVGNVRSMADKTPHPKTPLPTKRVTVTPTPFATPTPTPAPAIEFTPAPTIQPVQEFSAPTASNEPVLQIPTIGVNAGLIERGLDGEAMMEPPATAWEVSWYRFSGQPGQGRNIVLAGHVQLNQRPAVFAGLDELAIGDQITLTVNGQDHQYLVADLFYVPNDYPPGELTADHGNEEITMITCGGVWVRDPNKIYGGDYSDRLIVIAKHI